MRWCVVSNAGPQHIGNLIFIHIRKDILSVIHVDCGSFVGLHAFSLCQSIKIKPTNMYISSSRAQFKIDTRVLKLTPVHSRRVVNCPVQPRACQWDCVLWHNFSGMKRTCWTTGSWWCCLSLEVVSSIPTGSTMIYLCGLKCVFLCQSIKIKTTNIYYT